MPGTSEFGEISYTLTDCLISPYNKVANTFGAVTSLAVGQTVEIEPEADNDQLRGYGVKSALLSVIVGAKLKVGMGGVDISALAAMAGVSNYTSGLTPNQKRRTRFGAGGGGLPYFGLIGVTATDDGGYMACGLQACKLNTYPKYTLDGKENKFNMSETEGYAIPINIGGVAYLMTGRTFETPGDWTAPTDAASFLAFFSA